MHIFITFHARAITVYTFVTLYMNLHVPVLFIPHFLNASTDTVSYAVRDQKYFREREGGKPGHENFLITRIICNFIITCTVYNRRLFRSSNHKDIF